MGANTREEIEAYAYGAVGLARGVYEEYIKPEITLERAETLGYFALGAVGAYLILDKLLDIKN